MKIILLGRCPVGLENGKPFGKEKRKNQPSKEGLLGVEGLSEDIIVKALTDASKSLAHR